MRDRGANVGNVTLGVREYENKKGLCCLSLLANAQADLTDISPPTAAPRCPQTSRCPVAPGREACRNTHPRPYRITRGAISGHRVCPDVPNGLVRPLTGQEDHR
jgi:hypothetical protein